MIYCTIPFCGQAELLEKLGPENVAIVNPDDYNCEAGRPETCTGQFPGNVVQHLADLEKTHRYVFMYPDSDVIKAINRMPEGEMLNIWRVHPTIYDKTEWIQRAVACIGGAESFTPQYVDEHWDEWFFILHKLSVCAAQRDNQKFSIVLRAGQKIYDVALEPNGCHLTVPGTTCTFESDICDAWRRYRNAAHIVSIATSEGFQPLTKDVDELCISAEMFFETLKNTPMPTEESIAKAADEYRRERIGEICVMTTQMCRDHGLSEAKCRLIEQFITYVAFDMKDGNRDALDLHQILSKYFSQHRK